MELTRRDLTRMLGGMIGISMAGCTGQTTPTPQSNSTMNIEHESQKFEDDIDSTDIHTAELHRFVDDEYGNVLYVMSTNVGWEMKIAEMDS